MGTYSLKQYQNKIKTFMRGMPKQTEIALMKASELVRREAVDEHLSGPKMAWGQGSDRNATLARDTGKLATSIYTRVKKGGRPTGIVGSNLKYARIHEYGGTIVPVRARMLRFVVNGRVIYARRVRIPERSYLRASLEAKREDIKRVLLRHMMKYYDKTKGV